jgi:hypothetical protein
MQVSSKSFSVKSKNYKYCFNCCVGDPWVTRYFRRHQEWLLWVSSNSCVVSK